MSSEATRNVKGDIGDARTSILGSLYGILGNPAIDIATMIGAIAEESGLVFRGTVTAVPGANQFTIPTLTGIGVGSLTDVNAPYQAFVMRDNAGIGGAPQGEIQPVTAYVSGTGVFTTNAFTVAVGVGDEILILHPSFLTPAAAGFVDVAISTRAVAGDAMALTAAERLIVQALIINDVTPFAGANIDAAISSRAAPGAAMALTAAERLIVQALVLNDATPFAGGDIDVAISTRAAAATALSTAIWTAARGAYLDDIKVLTRPQDGIQATTNALAVVGVAITNTVPFKVSGFISLALMQAGDTFLVIEEIRDEDDASWIEYGRNSYTGVQVSPMIRFTEKVCQGWRVRIQRTAGADRNITYQYFTEVQNA